MPAWSKPSMAKVWLGNRLGATYLGDLVGAQAIRAMAERTGGFSSGIIEGLLSIEPSEQLMEKALIAMAAPNGRLIHLKIEDGKVWLSNRHGDISGEPVDLGAERSRTYGNATAWMILGQFARLPTAVVGDDSQRMDAWVLLHIGQCKLTLLRANEEGLGHLEHDLGNGGRVLCQDQSPIEAATQAMADLLSRRWAHADDWVDAALKTGSLPLLHRLTIALRTVRVRSIPRLSEWADEKLTQHVLPALNALLRAPLAGQAEDTP